MHDASANYLSEAERNELGKQNRRMWCVEKAFGLVNFADGSAPASDLIKNAKEIEDYLLAR